jgi:hypothetical protein
VEVRGSELGQELGRRERIRFLIRWVNWLAGVVSCAKLGELGELGPVRQAQEAPQTPGLRGWSPDLTDLIRAGGDQGG